jgi:hypothetical protein
MARWKRHSMHIEVVLVQLTLLDSSLPLRALRALKGPLLVLMHPYHVLSIIIRFNL